MEQRLVVRVEGAVGDVSVMEDDYPNQLIPVEQRLGDGRREVTAVQDRGEGERLVTVAVGIDPLLCLGHEAGQSGPQLAPDGHVGIPVLYGEDQILGLRLPEEEGSRLHAQEVDRPGEDQLQEARQVEFPRDLGGHRPDGGQLFSLLSEDLGRRLLSGHVDQEPADAYRGVLAHDRPGIDRDRHDPSVFALESVFHQPALVDQQMGAFGQQMLAIVWMHKIDRAQPAAEVLVGVPGEGERGAVPEDDPAGGIRFDDGLGEQVCEFAKPALAFLEQGARLFALRDVPERRLEHGGAAELQRVEDHLDVERGAVGSPMLPFEPLTRAGNDGGVDCLGGVFRSPPIRLFDGRQVGGGLADDE